MKIKSQSFAVWIPRYLESITATVNSRSLDEVAFSLRYFAAWAKKRGLSSPQQIRIDDLVAYCNRKPFSARYLGKQIGQLQFFFRWWSLRSGAPNPAHSLKQPARPRALPRPLDPDLLQGWLETQGEEKPTSLRNRAILEMLYACGIRKQELCGLTLDDLDLQNHQIRILQGKAGRQRVVPLAQRAEAWLLAYLQRARPLLLRGSDDRSLWIDRYGRRFNYGALTMMLAHSKTAAGIQAYGCAHLFRHSFASHLLSAGASVRVIQELLGHADLTSTQIYTQANISDLKRVHARCHPFEARRA